MRELPEEVRIANHLRSLNVRPQEGFNRPSQVNQPASNLPQMQPSMLQSLINYFSSKQGEQPQPEQLPTNAFVNPGGLRQAQEQQILNSLPENFGK